MSESWYEVAEQSDFSIRNLPLGVFAPFPDASPRCATILGDTVIDLSVLEEAELFTDIPDLCANTFNQPTLNAFIKHDRSVWILFRRRLIDIFDRAGTIENLQKAAFHDVSSVRLYLPISVGGYTDFYSSREHATNVGTMFRGKDNALQPNWLHLPVGYHGRSSTVFVSGQEVRRPMGQLQKDKNDLSHGSVYGPCRNLDFELEVAAVVGGPANDVGYPLTIQEAKARIFGFLLMNDWSARDIQKWEYVPLGPFTSKNFCTTVSPWIVMAVALDDFVAPTSAGQQVEPSPLEYLKDPEYSSYNMNLFVSIRPKDRSSFNTVCRSNFRNLYWNPAQQLVHHAVTGCVMQAGDLLGSGTISGQDTDSFGSMLELSWNGTKAVPVGGEERHFLNDGDCVVMTGHCQKLGHGRIGFGECMGTIIPAIEEGLIPRDTLPRDATNRYKDIKLYGYWRSSSTWRVRVALAAKAIDYKTIPISLPKNEHTKDDFLAKNPLGQVPLLEYIDAQTGKVVRMAQSIAIIDFLDGAFPSRRSMIPRDLIDRAAALEMVEVINAGTQPLQNMSRLKDIEKRSGQLVAEEEAKAVNERGLGALETLVKRKRTDLSGPYCLGTFSPTVVDAVLVPQLYNARRIGVDVDALFPLLVKVDALCSTHRWFKLSHPSVQPDANTD
jgi:fumarylacetoacetase